MSLAVRPSRKGPLRLDFVPEILRPLIRAYLLGYATAVGPRLLTLILQHVMGKRRKQLSPDQEDGSFVKSAKHIVRMGFNPQRFPTFCAVLAGGSTLLQEPLKSIIDKAAASLSNAARLRLARWISTFIAAWYGLRILHSYESRAYTETIPQKKDSPSGTQPQTIKFAGRTLDLTLFALSRALDVVLGDLWARRRARRQAACKWTNTEQSISRLIDPLVFSASTGLIMWAWFYFPETLPRSYNKWITSAAAVDMRLIEALRRCRKGEFQYGKDTGQTPLLEPMCADFNFPLEWADPSRTIPIPCDMVHMGCGPSCEYHTISRFFHTWKWSMATYFPLTLSLALRNPSRKAVLRAFTSACRSAAFLSTVITLFYYGVCLSRTRIGPRLLGTSLSCRQRIDSGLRRKDISLFVAPRAMATLLPRRYPLEKQWRETLVFAASTAIVFTCVKENPDRVRGVFGRLLKMVMKT
ncbi:hypothetical protein B0T10DRAFT_560385 [Thelonectria olida]|uniref:Integral membrane protein n=1 Tax=Thelonectria olida TaxID=1576542 RepID=A0A9P8W568_9HYPO|nr:hypothetical protein B0T10DRAFT_560385 [Thelonectria olida]